MNDNLSKWHDVVSTRSMSKLSTLLADDVVFHSPVVHAHQKGKKLTFLYLSAAFKVFSNESFQYVREVANEKEAVLEFEVEIDGILINGIDMISWNDDGKITDFKVMIRPLKGVNIIHQKMGELFAKYQRGS